MTELRRDPATDKWVIIAPQRGWRPHERAVHSGRPILSVDHACAFCPGNEAQLPGILAELTGIEKTGWRMRVVPNKFPAVSTNGVSAHHDPMRYEKAAGLGSHEVIIESPRHDHDLTTMPRAQLRDVLSLCRSRYQLLI